MCSEAIRRHDRKTPINWAKGGTKLKKTTILIDHEKKTATITIRQHRYIQMYMRQAANNDEWSLVNKKVGKNGRIESVSYTFPSKRLIFKRPKSIAQLERARVRATNARKAIAKQQEGEIA